MQIGLGLWLGTRQVGGFDPAAVLFGAGEQGGWYDSSDLSTMFQDSAGTTPVTATGQTVGLLLDKSQGLALGPELRGTGNTNIVGVATAAAYNTSTGVGSVSRVDVSNQSYVEFTGLTNGLTYQIMISCNTGAISVRSGLYNTSVIATLTTGQSITLYVPAASNNITVTNSPVAGTATFTLSAIKLLAGNHLTQTTAPSRPQYQIDANGLPFLLFDGTDDWFISPTITPGIDKAQVFAGVRKLSDATDAVVVESSTGSSAGRIQLLAPWDSGFSRYLLRSAGTTLAGAGTSSTAFNAPITNVLTGIGDIAGDAATLRVNGVQAATSAADQGTGNFLAYPLYVGRRGGTTLPFNGRLYQMIVRFGANLDASTIAATETFVNSKTGAYV